jgi:hypothetical protein
MSSTGSGSAPAVLVPGNLFGPGLGPNCGSTLNGTDEVIPTGECEQPRLRNYGGCASNLSIQAVGSRNQCPLLVISFVVDGFRAKLYIIITQRPI